jgi:methyltransferase
MRAAFVLLVALQRLAELAWSRRNRRRLERAGAVAAADPVSPAMVAVHAALLLGCLFEPLLAHRPFVPAIGLPALAVFLLAQALRVWALRTLGPHWNVRIYTQPTQDAPGERAPGFVDAGPYRLVRHPNYLAVTLEVAALPLFTSAWLTFVLAQPLHALVLARRIADEERALTAVPGYTRAMATRPRLIPRAADLLRALRGGRDRAGAA